MDPTWDLDDEQWSKIDAILLKCCPTEAHWLIREMIDVDPEASKHILLQRFHFLRAKRPRDFAWTRFPCEDYLASEWSDHGCWDTPFTMIIRPSEKVELKEELGMLVVGGPGCDGILWGYRAEHPGIWEYIPMTEEFNHRADSVEALVEEVFLRNAQS